MIEHCEIIHGKNVNDKQIMKLLDAMYFSKDKIGTIYIIDAMMLAINESDEYLLNLTGLLYPKIAGNYGINPKSVDRAIRTVIKDAFENISANTISDFLGNSLDNEKGYPTNSQFLMSLAEYIRYRL